MYLFPVPSQVAAWLVSRQVSRGSTTGGAIFAVGRDGRELPTDFSVDPLLETSFAWSRALALAYPAPQGTNARLFLFLPRGERASRVELRDFRASMREGGPAIVNLYLQRRLQSRSAVVERTRISRELHDGVIQALIGAEMQLEVTRRQADGRVPASLIGELMHIQRIIGQEVLNVRDLMQMLKPMDVDAARLVEYLASAVEQFRQRTGIEASFACEVEEIDLSPRVCREIAGIVQEALANVRKHAEATCVLIRLDMHDGDWRITIDDNGRGLDFEGYLSPDEVEAQRKGPVLIKERTRSINGRLAMYSHPGFGTKLEITIPRKHHA
jgi:signal transduction histidine kinase